MAELTERDLSDFADASAEDAALLSTAYTWTQQQQDAAGELLLADRLRYAEDGPAAAGYLSEYGEHDLLVDGDVLNADVRQLVPVTDGDTRVSEPPVRERPAPRQEPVPQPRPAEPTQGMVSGAVSTWMNTREGIPPWRGST